VGETQWGAERIASLKPGDKMSIRNYDIPFERTTSRPGSNYSELAAVSTVRRHAELIGIMEPSKRTFASRGGMATTEINADDSVAVRPKTSLRLWGRFSMTQNGKGV
jgi:cytochrome c-type biogenesis protein CcmF